MCSRPDCLETARWQPVLQVYADPGHARPLIAIRLMAQWLCDACRDRVTDVDLVPAAGWQAIAELVRAKGYEFPVRRHSEIVFLPLRRMPLGSH